MSNLPRLTEQDVIQFLKEHPDFFVNKDDLLCELRIPHDSGQATSLIERQLGVYRERNVSLRQQLSDLLENARRNDELFHQSRRLVMAIIEANSWLEIQTVLDDSLRREFMVDHWALLNVTERQLESPLLKMPMDTFKHKAQRIFRGHRSICGSFEQQEMALLLHADDIEAQSLAATQIRGKGYIGILSIASNSTNRYQQSTDTLFLDYIGDVLSLVLPQTPVVNN